MLKLVPAILTRHLMENATRECRVSFRLTYPKFSVKLKNVSASSKVNYSTQAEHTQTELPQLPVPPLQSTLEKYLRTVKPLVTDAEFKTTSEIVKLFGAFGGQGEILQLLLEKRAQMNRNWLADWWLQTSYLGYRSPVVVFSSPGVVFPIQNFNTPKQQLYYAAKMVAGAVDYHMLIFEDRIKTDMMGNAPLDMSQYHRIFGTCRIPGEVTDTIRFAVKSQMPSYITVVNNNHFFKMYVYGSQGEQLNEEQIFSQLDNIYHRSLHPAEPVGILTSDNRNSWGRTYTQLRKDSQNKVSLDAIQQSLFLLCLDGPNPETLTNNFNKETVCGMQMIHGGGSTVNSGNRWFDKTLQLIVGANGELGMTYEHSPAEGPPIASLMDHIMGYMSMKEDTKLPAVNFPEPVRLKFNVSDKVHRMIEVAKENIDSIIDDLEMTCFTFNGYGKDFIKSNKLSPDSFIQMAIQLAFYRLHKEPGAHYESGSTRKYVDGRTETIRSCSVESVEFAKAMLDEKKGPSVKLEFMQKAIQAHKNYSVEACNGFGVDRHLLGLKLVAIESGMDVPKLFLDTGFIRSSHMRLSTSQIPALCDGFLCYGPLVPDGYGCCYNPRTNTIKFGTSAFNSSPETNTQKFQQALEDSLSDMYDVLIKTRNPRRTPAPQSKL